MASTRLGELSFLAVTEDKQAQAAVNGISTSFAEHLQILQSFYEFRFKITPATVCQPPFCKHTIELRQKLEELSPEALHSLHQALPDYQKNLGALRSKQAFLEIIQKLREAITSEAYGNAIRILTLAYNEQMDQLAIDTIVRNGLQAVLLTLSRQRELNTRTLEFLTQLKQRAAEDMSPAHRLSIVDDDAPSPARRFPSDLADKLNDDFLRHRTFDETATLYELYLLNQPLINNLTLKKTLDTAFDKEHGAAMKAGGR
jgi:hypothetical protein